MLAQQQLKMRQEEQIMLASRVLAQQQRERIALQHVQQQMHTVGWDEPVSSRQLFTPWQRHVADAANGRNRIPATQIESKAVRVQSFRSVKKLQDLCVCVGKTEGI